MEIISNDLNRFKQDIDEYREAEQKLKNSYDALVKHVEELNSMWEGPAHKRFFYRFMKIQGRVYDFMRRVEIAYENLDYADSEYNRCENIVAAEIDGFQV